tara:strand:- start:11066 stop:11914 length:849 start_codon:yes stop_codon:yes gene_type:complete
MIAWQALASSVVLSLAAAGLALTMSLPHVNADLAQFLDLCVTTLQHHYASPGGFWSATAGMIVFLAVTGRAMSMTVSAALSDRRDREKRAATFSLIGEPDATTGAWVVPCPLPYAFCIGGRHRRIVLTSGLFDVLNSDQIRAVLAHERAHLRQRHHTALALSRALYRTLLPLFPRFRHAMDHANLLMELSADDSARRAVGSTPLLEALRKLSTGTAMPGTLAANGADVELRMARLAGQSRRMPFSAMALAVALSIVAVAIPFALAAAPVMTIASEGLCQVTI